MKTIIKTIIITFISLFCSFMSVNAQKTNKSCSQFHRKHCLTPTADGFSYYGQSRSALYSPGQVSERRIPVYKNHDYYLSVCSHRNLCPIHFQIYEVKGVDKRKLLYDNEQFDFLEEVLFTNTTSTNLIIEISVPNNEENNDSNLENDDFLRECVGVLIMWRRTPKTGF